MDRRFARACQSIDHTSEKSDFTVKNPISDIVTVFPYIREAGGTEITAEKNP